ncbi:MULTISPECIES: hypothetical protein [Fervidobacterium]|uniref:Lipoprotein n=1 Tax=Fervidobacterium nodosum (strain ATCC 35602 / DSM 5306 / Rt17-B1) TaxID=381764 RepID=A7HNA8_FERNB|nr:MULTISPECIES: hypothetical protein [Fervidobacterium]ABS61391.1 hypothetical protein Fnod_1548 [Fervidobacterium nodosum Rt17-B1]KAF2962185.1 hypothetical protein AS161_05755 [Fervidobacterium sp. 2310opik-2]PHJ14524.1 hypothetical protein IM41_00465 [Fervidobacterium sp. SC_NGM5_G05]HOJ94048.1 hypothetical protein [Fervidobacterium nodosum]
MKRNMNKIMFIALLSLLFVFSSCGIIKNNNSNSNSSTVKTTINIYDPYGNKLFIDGTINGYKIQADKDGVFVAAKIENVSSYKFNEELTLFKVKSVDVVSGKEVNIVLERNDKNGINILRTADGKLMFYAIGYGDKPYFQVWLKDRLAGFTQINLNKGQTLLAGNWLIGVGKGMGKVGLDMNPNEIVVKLNIPATNAPRIAKIEEIK